MIPARRSLYALMTMITFGLWNLIVVIIEFIKKYAASNIQNNFTCIDCNCEILKSE